MRIRTVVWVGVFSTVAVIGGLIVFQNWKTWFPLRDKIAATAVRNPFTCKDQAYPIWVSLSNESSKTITQTLYSVSVRRAGHSSVLAQTDLVTDKILEPGASYEECLAIPGKTSDELLPAEIRHFAGVSDKELEYSVKVTSVQTD